MTPDIILDKEGYNILLASAPRNPEADYRKLVEQYAKNGELNEFAFLVLTPKRKTLGITDTKAEEIEKEVLEPFQRRLENLQSYKQAFAKAVEQKYPLDEHILNILKDYQQEVLGLRDEDVASIELEITSVKEAEYQKQIQIQKQQEKEEYENKLERYEQELAKAVQAQYPLDEYVRNGLKQFQQSLQLRDEDVASIELKITSVKEAEYQQQLQIQKQQEAERLQLQQQAKELSQLYLQQEAEKNKSGYQLNTFQFETAQITLKSSLLGLVKTPEIKRITKSVDYFAEDLGNDVFLRMVHIPGGTFLMGCPENEESAKTSELPQHLVTVPSFFMGKYLVTQKQWRLVAALPKVKIDLKSDPSYFKGHNLPVENVFWDHAQEFCARLSQKTNKAYRLPSEAEWEYACRGGTTTPFYCGETIYTDLANYNGKHSYGSGIKGEYREKTTEVGKFPANPFGLYDMCGNLCQWCEDEWHDNYINAPINGSAWLSGNDGNTRALRGGSWNNNPDCCRSASRLYNVSVAPDTILSVIGFRVVCAVGRN